MTDNSNNKILVCIDGSYFMYYCLFGAVNRFMTKYKEEASMLIKPSEETDQTNLPSLLISNNFKKELKDSVIKRCEFIDFILKKNFQDEIDQCVNIDIIFALDDSLNNSFRKVSYPDYKAQRKLIKRSYSTTDLRQYILNVIFPELDVNKQFGYCTVKVDGAEGDDVIACTLTGLDGYFLKVLFASDKDFLQLENVKQFDLRGKEVLPEIKLKNETVLLSNSDFLLMKILMGDAADNIPSIAERFGTVKSYNMVNNKEHLKTFLKENKSAAQRFIINKNLIDFRTIPDELRQTVVKALTTELSKKPVKFENIDLTLQNIMEL